MTPKLLLGLAGGIGSGKSAVAEMLQERGGYVIDADQLGHEALKQAEIREQIVARWGRQVQGEGNEIARRKLGAIVFADSAERNVLESYVFPFITRRIQEEVARANADPAVRFVVLDAAILLETGWGKACDVIVFVSAPQQTRLNRIAEERGWSEKEVQAREGAQWSLEDKAARAHAVIDNSGSLNETRNQVEALLRRLQLM